MSRKDWVEGRNSEDFVHRGEDRSGWEEENSSSSEYLIGKNRMPKTPEQEIKEVYQICRTRGRNMAEGKPFNIKFSPDEDTGHTDGKNVFVSTKVMDENKPFTEKADIMLGITTHEMAHIQHTDFKLMKKELTQKFEHAVWNIIEDERIEREVGESTPGYSRNIASVKKYLFDEKYLLGKMLASGKKLTTVPADPEEEEEDPSGIPKHLIAEEEDEEKAIDIMDEERAAAEVFDMFFKFVRYPKHLDDDMISRHEVAIDELKEILTPYPRTAVEAVETSKKVSKIIKKHMDEEMDDPSKSDELSDMIADSINQEMGSDNEEEGEPGPRGISESVQKYDYTEERVEDPDWKAIFRKGEPNEGRYKELLSEVSADAHLLANILYIKCFNEVKFLKGMRSGILDDNRIVEAAHGVKTVHMHKIEKESRKLNLAVVIDESGSMGDGVKDRNAAKVAILLEKAFQIFPVGQLFIYGFTSDHCHNTSDYTDMDFNTIFRYREPGLNIKYGLGDVQGRSNNRDGHCIRAAARRIRQFTQEPMLMFIISDGMPAGSRYNGTGAIKDTRAAVTEVTRMKFFPIQIGIEDILPEQQRQMYDEFVNYKSSRQMVEEIRKLLMKKAHKIMGL
jgi:hypothetical protein